MISSTWRADPSMFAFLKFALNQYQITIDDITPHLHSFGRGAEVRYWIDQNPHVNSFVIIDDEHV